VTKQFFLDSAERAVATFVEVLVVMLFAADGSILVDPQWGTALAAAGIAAGVSVLTSVASIPVPPLSPLLDLAFRVAKTFIQAFVGAFVATGPAVDWKGALTTAFPVALLALLKGLAAMHVPHTGDGPSLLPQPMVVDADPQTAPVEVVPPAGRHAAPEPGNQAV
jgi:Putative lactococcus lactis phage r1t holin